MGFTTLLAIVIIALLIATSTNAKPSTSLIPALIVFGDSIMDPGNNNDIKTIIKCNFAPYGYNFYGRTPTGRFCNGKIPTDIIASKLGIKELLPAYDFGRLSAHELLTGVSFASGGAGYDPLTSQIGSVISMEQQLEQFKEYKNKIISLVGEAAAEERISKSVYLSCAGSDDVANNYYGLRIRKAEYNVDSYTNLLITYTSSFVQRVADLGAKKIAVTGIPPIGCVPAQRTLGGGIQRDCSEEQNAMARLYNSKLIIELQRLTNSRPGTQFIYFDTYTPLYDIMQNPTKYGFKTSAKGCCGTGKLEVSVLCNSATSEICSNPNQDYVFWDSFHPTQRTYEILVQYLYDQNIHFLS